MHAAQSANFRAENIRLQDEYYSMKSRLTAALEAQQELMRKNQELHRLVGELQGSVASLKDDVSTKEASIAYIKVGIDRHCITLAC